MPVDKQSYHNTNLEIYENDSLSRVNSPLATTGRSTEPRLAVTTLDRGTRSDTEGLIIRTPSERGSSVLPNTMPTPQPVGGAHQEPWWNRRRLTWTKKSRWCFILTPLSICLIIALVVVVVVWQTTDSGSGGDVKISLSTLTAVTLPQSSALPRANSGLAPPGLLGKNAKGILLDFSRKYIFCSKDRANRLSCAIDWFCGKIW